MCVPLLRVSVRLYEQFERGLKQGTNVDEEKKLANERHWLACHWPIPHRAALSSPEQPLGPQKPSRGPHRVATTTRQH